MSALSSVTGKRPHSRCRAGVLGAALLAALGCNAETSAQRAPEASIPQLLDASHVEGPSGGASSVSDSGATKPVVSARSDAGMATHEPARDLDAAPFALPVQPDDDAGPYTPPDPKCADDVWRLAPGFLPAKRVDYIADRDASPAVPLVLSAIGTPCATARDRAACEASLALAVPFARHLVTTAGDSVRIWPAGSAALELLGAIDTPAEALWWLTAAHGYSTTCATQVTKTDRGFEVRNFMRPFNPCDVRRDLDAAMPADATLIVLPSGETLEQGSDGGPMQGQAPCGAL
jgi:hypothetical protein